MNARACLEQLFEEDAVRSAAHAAGYTVGPVYHGSPGKFHRFDSGKIGSRNDMGYLGKGFYFTDDRDTAYSYGEPRAFYLKLARPRVDGDYSGVGYMNALPYNPTHQDGATWEHGRYGDEDRHKEYVIRDPHQIKSADPVTYDDEGNLIPLEQRFDAFNADVRY